MQSGGRRHRSEWGLLALLPSFSCPPHLPRKRPRRKTSRSSRAVRPAPMDDQAPLPNSYSPLPSHRTHSRHIGTIPIFQLPLLPSTPQSNTFPTFLNPHSSHRLRTHCNTNLQILAQTPKQLRKMPSVVWDYFDEFEGGGRCRLCGCVRNRKDKSTSTFWQHLERVHGLDKRQMMGSPLLARAKVKSRPNTPASEGSLSMVVDTRPSNNCNVVQEQPPEKMPKLDFVSDGLGLDRRATEETFKFISELVKQQQQQPTRPVSVAESAIEAPKAADLFDKMNPQQNVQAPPIGINNRALEQRSAGASSAVAIGIGGREGQQQRKMPENHKMSASNISSNPLASFNSNSSFLNNYLSGLLEYASSPANFSSIVSSASNSPSPSLQSPVPSASNVGQAAPILQQPKQELSPDQSEVAPKQEDTPTTNNSLNTSGTSNQMRTDHLSWDEFFMGTALLAAQRSKDPVTQVGACIVKKNIVVGIGYNGMPNGCADAEMPWGKEDSDPLNNKYLYVCHAEMNAITNKNTADVKGATIYTTMFPCSDCAKLIIQSGIQRVVYLNDKQAPQMTASRRLFNMTGIEYSKFESTHAEIVLRIG